MGTLTALALIALLAVTSFVPRASFILWLHRVKLPSYIQRALRFVPAAVFTALFVPQLVFADGVLDIGLHNAKLLAGCSAIGIAMVIRNPLATILAGMAVLHLARNFLGT
jgi:branched-subunit amino acid transport protein